MKKKIFIMSLIIISILFVHRNNSYAAGMAKVDGTEKEKIICVVFDNSSSMFQDDEAPYEYTDRWVQADYAMKAFALMMNAGDTLKPYIMGDYKNGNAVEDRTIVIQKDSNTTLKKLESCMENMTFTEWTYFEGVEAAVRDLQKLDRTNKDCWIIILTDGRFETKNVKISDEELQTRLEDITKNHRDISIAYVPIGEGAAELEENRSKQIYTAKGASIMEQVTEIINLIYGRVQLDRATRDAYVEQIDETGKLQIYMDVPVEKMIVFLQDSGEIGNYVGLEDSLNEELNKKITNEEPVKTDAFQNVSEISFAGRKNLPGMELDVKTHDDNLIKYCIRRGLIYNFEGNPSPAMDMRNQYVSIGVDSAAYDTVDVYYQPAVLVEVDYYQNGEKVEHGEECTAVLNNEETEKCVREGEMTIQLYMTDSSGEKIEEQNSPLLYERNFEVELLAQNGTVVTSQNLGNYRYQFEVQEGDYTLNVRTAWNELYEKKIEVQEPVRPLRIERYGGNKIWIDQPERDGSILAIQITEDGEPVTQSAVDKMDVKCEVSEEGFRVDNLGYQGNGIWNFRILLEDYEQHQIVDSIHCNIEAVRRYDSGTARETKEEKKEPFELDIVSGGFEFVIEPETEVLLNCYTRVLGGENIPLSYLCNGQELTEKQKKGGLEVIDFQISPSNMKKYFKVDRNNNLRLKGSLLWLFFMPEEIEVVMEVAYERYNTIETITYEGIFSVMCVSIVVKIGICILVGLLVLWFLIFLFKKKLSKFYIGRIRAEIVGRRGGVVRNVKVKRWRQSIFPFCNTARLIFTESEGESVPYIRSFHMKFIRDTSGDSWRIINYGDFADSKRYKIGRMSVTEGNRNFSERNPFIIIDKYGNERELKLHGKNE